MIPLKKRQRLMAEQQQKSEHLLESHRGTKPTLESIQSVFADLIAKLQQQQRQQSDSLSRNEMESLRQPFCQIAEWQRQLYDTIALQEAKLGALTANRIKSQRKEHAEAYERSHLQSQIDRRQKFATPNLDQLAREETGSTGMKNDDSIDQLKQKFLEADPDNPTHRGFIVAKLQECLEQRAALEKVAETKRQVLQIVTKQIQEKKDFLKSLPQHVKTIQRASAGLAKYVAQQPSSLQHMSGSTRLQRLEMAQRLPAPLYTVYALLQQYVDETVTAEQQQSDVYGDPEGGTNASSPSARIRLLVSASSGPVTAAVTSSSSSTDEVVLQLPVEDFVSTTNTSKKRVSIHFRYHDQPRPVITAYATGCPSTLNQDILLEELFAGDRAMILEPTPAATAAATGPQPPQNQQAKSYQWCNYLAGLYYTPPEPASAITKTASSPPLIQQQQHRRLSTRLIMHELQKRVRANAAWKHIWSSLQRNHVPLPSAAVPNNAAATDSVVDTYLIPSHDPTWKPSCKLTGFVEACVDKTSTTTSLTTFQVTLRHNSEALSCFVTIDTVRYPAVPPVWNLLCSSSPSSSPQLYDSRLAQLQQQVNQDALTRVIPARAVSGSATEANDNKDSVSNNIVSMTKVSATDIEQQYYEWILVHQLREIMHQWELHHADETTTMASSTMMTESSARTRRGRDRKLLT